MKFTHFVLMLFFGGSVFSQTFENGWAGMFSYTNIIEVVEGNDKFIAASENALFIYDFTRRDIKTFSSVNGLSGDLITTVYYSNNYDLVVIGYINGLIEIILEDDRVLKVVDILNKPTIPPTFKNINHFSAVGENLYISTGYGISVFNMALLEFGDTYFIGDNGFQDNVNATVVHDNYIYAALDNQVKRAQVNNPNLIDYNQWQDFYPFGLTDLAIFRGNLYAVSTANSMLTLTGGTFNQVASFPQSPRKIKTNSDYLTVTTTSHAYVYDRNLNQVNVTTFVIDYLGYTLSSAFAKNQKVYLGSSAYGILEVPFGTNQGEQILPEGPIRNDPFAIDVSPGQLWVVFGEITQTFNPYPLNQRGISRFFNNEWTKIPYEDLLGARSIVNITINPSEPEQVYASSMIDGLLKINGAVPSFLLNQTNSVLNQALSDNSIRIYGSRFDRQNNLWFVQSGSEFGLHRMNTNGQIQSFDITSVLPNPELEIGLNKVAISNQNQVFFGSRNNGLIGFNPATNAFRKIGEGPGNGNLPRNTVRGVAVDRRNQLWIGTERGLRVVFNTNSFFESNTIVDAQPIIIMDGDIAQELLFEQSITDIEVDGSNNKWVATATSGVFYFSPNGQETLLRFTKENSPLPSNTVNDISIDPVSGVVYFATPRGLVAYNGSATAPNDNLKALRAYPNPVRPGFSGNVTIDGLTARANVKITDVNGSLVFEQTSEGGSILWDTTAFGKYRVASGVYFIMATTEDASETKVAKVMIVR
jgi:hypothetical protein